MTPVLVTERLVLSGIVADDAADLFAFRSDPVEQRYNDPPLRTLDEAHDLIRRLDRERREFDALHWGVTLAGDDRVYVGAWTRLVLRPATDEELVTLV